MLRTIYGKLAISLLVLLVFFGVLLFVVNLMSTGRFLQEINQGLHRDLAAHLVAEAIPLEDGEVQTEALEHIFHILMVVNPAIEVYLLDAKGGLLAYSAPDGSVVRPSVSLDPISEFLNNPTALPILGDDPRDTTGRKIFSVATVGSPDLPDGYLYVILGGQRYDSAVAMIRGSHILRLGLGASIAAFLFAVASGLLLFAFITRRIRRLDTAVGRYKESNFRERPELAARDVSPTGDEIQRLGASFDEMSRRIGEHLDELETTDALRRELVANVSHDLRTPLTALRGYLETLHVKRDSLTEAERHEYLEIALNHSQRMASLVSELFELAKLESCATELQLEPFALAELVQDAIQEFRLLAESKEVKLHADLPREAKPVRADLSLIARVLDNLIDNAIRHTPAGGSVTVRLVPGEAAHQVKVEDTGPGIPSENLPRLFDRFFHRPAGADSVHPGSGLGLAIAQKALELHGASLEVVSEVGAGSCFEFELAIDCG